MKSNSLYLLILLLFVLNQFTFAQTDRNRDKWQQPEKVMDVIGVKEGMTIGESGAGKGYFTFKLSKRIGKNGKIYANDISKKKLKYIGEKCEEENIKNITTILGEVEDPLFPINMMDMVIMVYVFHDLEKPIEFLKNIIPSLKMGAKVVIIDRDPDKYGQEYDHFLTRKVVVSKIKKAGYQLDRVETFLPRDNIYICSPPIKVSK